MLTSLKQIVRKSPALERAARYFIDQRYQLARKYLKGVGVEIGALHLPLFLPKKARAFYLDRLMPTDLRLHYPELSEFKLFVSLVDDGETMPSVKENSLNFLIANHMIEHTEDPIQTLKTFAAKLKTNGILFMAVPDKDKTFDLHREETSWEHHWDDHVNGTEFTRSSHYLEWAVHVNGLKGIEAEKRAEELMKDNYSIHFHCWTLNGFLNFLSKLSGSVPLRLLEYKSWKNENVFILQKQMQ